MEIDKLKRYLVYLILIALLFLIGIYLFKHLLNNSVFKQVHKNHFDTENIADSYIKQAHVVSFASGFPKFDFTSSYILHYPGEKESSAHRPKLTVFDNKIKYINNEVRSPSWLAIADYAWLSEDTTNIRMEDNVVIVQKKHQVGNQRRSFLQLETEILWIWPKIEYAQTDRQIKITTDQALITAIGMNANLQATQYNFLNDVHVTLKQ